MAAAASRESGYQRRYQLHGVEVPPTPFIGMISKAIFGATVGTGNARAHVFEARKPRQSGFHGPRCAQKHITRPQHANVPLTVLFLHPATRRSLHRQAPPEVNCRQPMTSQRVMALASHSPQSSISSR